MSSYVGIDLSSFVLDIIVLDEETNDATHHRRRLDTGPGNALVRARRVRDALPTRGAWRDSGVLGVAIEKPMGQLGGVTPLLIVIGAIVATLPPEIPLELVRSDDWRKRCGLKIRGARPDLKAAAVSFAREHWANPSDTVDDNIADAFGIAWSLRQLARTTADTKAA